MAIAQFDSFTESQDEAFTESRLRARQRSFAKAKCSDNTWRAYYYMHAELEYTACEWSPPEYWPGEAQSAYIDWQAGVVQSVIRVTYNASMSAKYTSEEGYPVCMWTHYPVTSSNYNTTYTLETTGQIWSEEGNATYWGWPACAILRIHYDPNDDPPVPVTINGRIVAVVSSTANPDPPPSPRTWYQLVGYDYGTVRNDQDDEPSKTLATNGMMAGRPLDIYTQSEDMRCTQGLPGSYAWQGGLFHIA